MLSRDPADVCADRDLIEHLKARGLGTLVEALSDMNVCGRDGLPIYSRLAHALGCKADIARALVRDAGLVLREAM